MHQQAYQSKLSATATAYSCKILYIKKLQAIDLMLYKCWCKRQKSKSPN